MKIRIWLFDIDKINGVAISSSLEIAKKNC